MKSLLYDDGEVRVKYTELEDLDYLAENMRECDVDEVWASDNLTPLEALYGGFEESTFCCTVENGNPIAIFGVSSDSLFSNNAAVWLLATDQLVKIQRRFLRYSRYFIDRMLERYPYLHNQVDARNKKSIKWLKMCGAHIDEPKPFGAEQKPFRYFYFKRSENNV